MGWPMISSAGRWYAARPALLRSSTVPSQAITLTGSGTASNSAR
jgi:hypothetical protein